MNSAQHIEMVEHYGAHNYHPLPVVVSRAQGAWVYDADGKRYLDMLSAYSALNFGHCNPDIVAAAKAQLDRCTLTSRAFHNDQLGPFCKALSDLTKMDVALPMNSGAEGVETALKTARKWAYTQKGVPADKAEIIVCHGNFHGRTIAIVSFSTDDQTRDGYGPFTPGFKIIPYGDAKALRAAITPNTAAFMVEPIQGEGGIIMPPAGFLKEARQICTDNNILLVLDEIQTGLGRTGRLLACEYEGVKPDVLILGKALGGGIMPVSATLASRKIMSVFTPGDHGSTFGGNPLACAVALKSIEILAEGSLIRRAAEFGEFAMAKLRAMNSPLVKEVRGRGLLIGIELTEKTGKARPYCEKLMQEGLLCKETHERVIRLAPPLVIEQKDLEWALELVGKVLK